MKSLSDREGSGGAGAHSSAAIEISSLCKSYGQVPALDGVSLSIGPGEFIALLGPSGSGKSTLLMSIAGFIRPDSGRIVLDGEEIVRLPANRRGFGVVFQNYALFPHMTVLGNVAFPLQLRGVSPAEQQRRAERALDMVKLSGFGARRISELSGGQRQRVALARAIVFEPRVLLMDEPLSALDKALREQMQLEIRELHDRFRITTIYVTHDQREALTIADRVGVMAAGRLVQIDTPETLYRKPCDEFVARFIGEAAILPMSALDPGASPAGVKAVVRSEDFLLEEPADASACLSLSGLVQGIVFQGESWLLRVQLKDGPPIDVRAQRRSADAVERLRPSQSVRLFVKRGDIHLL